MCEFVLLCLPFSVGERVKSLNGRRAVVAATTADTGTLVEKRKKEVYDTKEKVNLCGKPQTLFALAYCRGESEAGAGNTVRSLV